MAHVVILERTESFTVTVESVESEFEAIQEAKRMIRDDDDMGGQWSDSLEFTHEEAFED